MKELHGSLRDLAFLVESDQYLFHLTNQEGFEGIVKSGVFKPLTFDGSRELYGLVTKGKELATTSFTSNPLALYENDGIGDFCNKNIIFCMRKETLVHQGVSKVIYLSLQDFKRNHLDYLVAIDDCDYESEWRSLTEIDLASGLEFIFYLN